MVYALYINKAPGLACVVCYNSLCAYVTEPSLWLDEHYFRVLVKLRLQMLYKKINAHFPGSFLGKRIYKDLSREFKIAE